MKLTIQEYLAIKPKEDACLECSDAIWYPHTLVVKSKDGDVTHVNSTFKTHKKIGDSVYSLRICYSCLCKFFPEINSKNSSKLFNTCNKYVKKAFLVSDTDFEAQRKRHSSSLEKMIKAHGEEKGTKKWKEYCEKQRVTNTFEYKKEKYNWSKDDFLKYNKSRAVTKNNLISKYGEDVGSEKWNEYCEKQKYTKSVEYLIKKFGKEKGIEEYLKINKSKALTLDNYILKYGALEGLSKFREIVLSRDVHFSKASQSFFTELDSKISHLNLSTYYHSKNGEFGKLLKSIGKYCKLDFYIKEINLAIEYYGDYWHANPKLYQTDDVLFSNKMACDIWEVDSKRILALLNEHQIETRVVWQTDDLCNHTNTINQLIDEITSKTRKN